MSRTSQLPPAWVPLKIFTLYRLVIALLFTLITELQLEGKVFASISNPSLNPLTHLYLYFGLLALLLSFRHWPSFRIQVIGQVLADILFISLLMHFAGGTSTGLGALLAVSVSASCLLLARTRSLLFAALASLAILGQQSYQYFFQNDNVSFVQAGILGATYFATSALSLVLAKRLQQSEQQASESKTQLSSLMNLNDRIVQHMTSGVLAVDQQGLIKLLNQSAWKSLDLNSLPGPLSRLQDIAPEIASRLQQWQQGQIGNLQLIRQGQKEFNATFSRTSDSNPMLLIFLEDASILAQQAQQLKLAALGRLTASIAHEIRNPLGALSHASQLLQESSLAAEDQHLLDIIQRHCQRMNQIIENVLRLSQRRSSQPTELKLLDWLEHFCQDFTRNLSNTQIQIHVDPEYCSILFDDSQLTQVLTNLCDNGLRYSQKAIGEGRLMLSGGITLESVVPYLDIIDFGEGIAPSQAQNIFEPFFTTESKGTGLGLFIARELCDANQARLEYLPVASGGSCFRITFAPAAAQSVLPIRDEL